MTSTTISISAPTNPGLGTPDHERNAHGGWTRTAESTRQLERLLRRSRSITAPRNLVDGEQYRTFLLSFVDRLGAQDVTDAEKAETTAWRARILDASTAELWAEYDAGRVF